MVSNPICFFLAVSFLLLQSLGLTLGLLQLLQLKFYATNTAFIRFLIDKLGFENIPKMLEV